MARLVSLYWLNDWDQFFNKVNGNSYHDGNKFLSKALVDPTPTSWKPEKDKWCIVELVPEYILSWSEE